jgi:sugar phosphate isomerase/epimerase
MRYRTSDPDEKPRGYFGKYWFGVAVPLTVAEHTGVEYSIRWGAKQVELGWFPTQIGETGRRVIKELGEANKLSYTYHFPVATSEGMTPYVELAVPHPEIKARVKETLDESRKYAEDVGAKVIVFHPTATLPQEGKEEVLVWDEFAQGYRRVRIPKPILEKAKSLEEARREALKVEKEYELSELKDIIERERYFASLWETEAEEASKLAELTQSLAEQKKIKKETLASLAEAIKVPPTTLLIGDLRENLKELSKRLRRKAERAKSAAAATRMRAKAIQDRYYEFLPPEPGAKPRKELLMLGKEVAIKTIAENLAPVAAELVKRGIKVAIENMPHGFAFSTPQEIAAVVKELHKKLRELGVSNPEKYVGSCFDMGHAGTMRGVLGLSPSEYLGELVKRGIPITHVHAHYGRLVDEHLPVGEEPRKKAEEWERIRAALKKIGYPGEVVMEPGRMKGTGYYVSLQEAYPGFFTAYGIPFVGDITGRSYVITTPFDPVHVDKREHYFTDSFVGSVV